METKHTPGPWRARDYKTHDGDIWVDCDSWRNRKTASCRGGTLATVLASGVGKEGTVEANARLIAAAPDLLAVLKDVLRDMEKNGEVTGDFDHVRAAPIVAAIAKAEGR